MSLNEQILVRQVSQKTCKRVKLDLSIYLCRKKKKKKRRNTYRRLWEAQQTQKTDRQTACVGGEQEEETAATAATTTTEQIGSQVTAIIEPVGKPHTRGGGKGDRCRTCKGRDDVHTPISSTKNKLIKHTLPAMNVATSSGRVRKVQ